MEHRGWIRIAGWSVGVAFALISIGLLFLALTSPGRRLTADVIEDLVSDRIPGWMQIGRLERVGTPTVVSDLFFFHPNGTVVLHLKRAEIDFDFVSLLGGKLEVHRARTEGGTFSLSIEPDGRSSIEAVLSSPGPAIAGEESSFRYALRNIDVKSLLLVLKLAEDTTYRVYGVEGRVSVVRAPTGATVELHGISGRVKPNIAGMRVRLARVDGWVHGNAPQVLQLNARVHVGDGTLRAKVALFDRDETPVEIRLKPLHGVAATFTAFLAYANGLFSEDLDIALSGT